MVDFLPDLSHRHSSAVALIPLSLTYYALGVLAILPNTFLFRLMLQPIFLWQAWGCITSIDFSAWLAQSLGLENADSTGLWNASFMTGMFCLVLRSFEWTFIIKEPIRKYDLTMDQGALKASKKPLSISSVLLDGLDLFFNLRGIGWSWSPQPSLRWTTAPPSIPSLFASFLLRVTMFDVSRYLIQLVCPAISSGPSGGSIFDPNLSPLPRIASAAFASICGGFWTYLLVDTLYHISALIGRIVCRQPASHWPPISHRPWLSTSLHEFWSYRWHQLFRHIFVTFGARPAGALLGQPGSLIGAFAVSAAMHHFAMWGVGYGSEFSTSGGFFLLMGVGVAIEVAFRRLTGKRVGGFFGWLWTMLWVLVCGMFMIDAWGRHGMLASEFFPARLRPGKLLVDAVIGQLNVMANRWDVDLRKLNESALQPMIDWSSAAR
ncbi:hypothetical protein EDB87DRAFT_962841 [Lactarius vividus]|nr:hypothetical protein EDB87DRAFT_962841 [Lactarius vividus]